MVSFSTGFGRPSGGGFFGPSYGGLKAPEPINSRAEDYKSPGDNRSPAGQTIPAGIGTCSYDGKIVWWSGFKVKEGKVTASFVMLFADCIFTDSFALIKLFADEKVIISNTSPRKQSSQKIRFCDGLQTTPDRLLVEKLGADKASAWPGYVYAVFEDFDCGPYGNRVPLIRAVLSGAVTEIAATSAMSTLTFGPGEGEWNYTPSTVDRARGLHYQINNTVFNEGTVSVIDIASNTEISRADITAAEDWRSLEHPVALDGSDFMACTVWNPIYELALLNVMTGQIVAKLPVQYDIAGQPYEPTPKCAVMIANGAATKYLIFCTYMFIGTTGAPKSWQGIALADATNGTLQWVAHPYVNPLVGEGEAYSVAIGPVEGGVCTIWYTDTNGGVRSINEAVVSTSGQTSRVLYTSAELSTSYPGVAYDDVTDTLMAYLSDGRFRRLSRAGAVQETYPATLSDLNINFGVTPSIYGLTSTMRPGYVAALQGNDQIYQIDLSDGTATHIFDGETIVDGTGFSGAWNYPFWHYDQLSGVITVSAGESNRMWKGTLGDMSPDSVGLVDIITQIYQAAFR